MDLKGMQVLITRPREQASEMVEEVARRGATPLVIPMIRIVAEEDDGTFLRLIPGTPPFDAVVFASANAVSIFVDRCALAGVTTEQLSLRNVFAVGDRTRRELERRGIRVAESPGEFSGAALAAMLAARNLRGKRFLFPRGDIGRDEVLDAAREAGAECQPIVLYHTVGPEPADAAEARERTLRREFDIVTFTSPSAVRNFAGLFSVAERRSLAGRMLTAVIGTTTAQAVEEAGLHVHIRADVSTGSALVEALNRYAPLQKRTQHNTTRATHT
jgi:uroporphyrinogen III methyltransferase / synthase